MLLKKLKMIWNILRGKPVMYRINISNGQVLIGDRDHAIIYECYWRNEGPTFILYDKSEVES